MTASATLTLRVYYEDTDASGVAYHASYLRWFERGRTEWLRALGFDQQQLMREQGIAFTISDLSIRYRRPARLDDLLQVQTEVVKFGRASLQFRQRLSGPQSLLLSEAEVRAGCVDSVRFSPIALPAAILHRLRGPELAD